jgi:hypothetical protein
MHDATSATHGASLDSESAMEMSLFENVEATSKLAGDEIDTGDEDDDDADDDFRKALLSSRENEPAEIGMWPQARNIVMEVLF